jgi:hypothetical protein
MQGNELKLLFRRIVVEVLLCDVEERSGVERRWREFYRCYVGAMGNYALVLGQNHIEILVDARIVQFTASFSTFLHL